MITKQIVPWKVKVGDQIVIRDLFGIIRKYPVIKIVKEKGRFTGKSVWRVYFNEIDTFGEVFVSYHAKLRDLPLQKVKIFVKDS